MRGRTRIVVDAWDQVDGNEARRRLGLYRLAYQVLGGRQLAVPGFERPRTTVVFDRLPPDPRAAQLIYAEGTGITVYGNRRTRFLYVATTRVVDGEATEDFWDPATLLPGPYILRAIAADAAGNETAGTCRCGCTIDGGRPSRRGAGLRGAGRARLRPDRCSGRSKKLHVPDATRYARRHPGTGGPLRRDGAPRAVRPPPCVTTMSSFEAVYREHFGAVFRLAMATVGRRDLAEDLTAEAFLALHQQFGRIRVDELPAWLFVVVRNRARDHWRRERVRDRHARWVSGDPPPTVPPPAGPRVAPRRRGVTGAAGLSRTPLRLGIHGLRGRRAPRDVGGTGEGTPAAGPAATANRRWDEPVSEDDVRDGLVDEAMRRDGAAWLAERDACPHPDLLLARGSDALDAERARGAGSARRGLPGLRRLLHRRRLAPARPVRPTPRGSRVRASRPGAIAPVAVAGAAGGGRPARVRYPRWWVHSARPTAPTSARLAAPAAAPIPARPAPAGPAPIVALWAVEPLAVRVPISAMGVPRSGAPPRDARGALAVALGPYQAGRYADAIPELESVWRSYPESADAALYLGVAYLLEDRPTDALGAVAGRRLARWCRPRRRGRLVSGRSRATDGEPGRRAVPAADPLPESR